MKIDIVQADDWEAIYIDGVSVYQDHFINLTTFTRVLAEHGVKLDIKYSTVTGSDLDAVEDSGYLPEQLSDLKNL